MYFLSLNNVDTLFTDTQKLIWKLYTTAKALPTIRWVKLIDKQKFAKVALDENSETTVVYVIVLEVLRPATKLLKSVKIIIYPFQVS